MESLPVLHRALHHDDRAHLVGVVKEVGILRDGLTGYPDFSAEGSHIEVLGHMPKPAQSPSALFADLCLRGTPMSVLDDFQRRVLSTMCAPTASFCREVSAEQARSKLTG